ncbi:MAG: bifunctional 4-hydroxy-2-oxoglutarate aldolase/2-dehydro-3-deoxy-phosphogluconate aldolase [Rhizobiaceae bacterium]|nr:bifunctional 4-hydroxy-2-oxoglutarate aldolase/2-dehydro-3-deoxy-phosphogluconate aldolase [Rhizobiaceae bacterium]
MKNKNERLSEVVGLAPVIPVLQFNDPEIAVQTSRALVAGGLPVIEITLRTPQALACISAVAKQVEGAVVGAGTVMTPGMMRDCVEIGCQFLVSPGATQDLIEANQKVDVPLLPGVATPSEAMGLMAEGYEFLKFFPAEQAGGPQYLKSLAPVLQGLKFCPTGGLTAEKAPQYLALDNVVCVGGSWVAPKEKIAAGDWDGITELAAAASALDR